MIYLECSQGSAEWHRARAGCLTASLFWLMRGSQKLVRGPRAGGWSDAQMDLAMRLACERISGGPLLEEQFETAPMRRGHKLEPVARSLHEARCGVWVERVGFIKSDDGRYGASLDGRIDADGTAEYKALIGPTTLRKVLLELNADGYKDQVQGQLWLSGRLWCDFVVFVPFLESIGKDLMWKRVYRDDDFIESLEQDLLLFSDLVDETERSVRGATSDGWFTQAERVVRKAQESSSIRVMPAPMPKFAGLSRYELARMRIAATNSAAACDLILDGVSDLPADEYAQLHALAKQRFGAAV